MDDWLKQLQETLDVAAQDMGERLSEFSQQANQVVEQVVEPALDQMFDQMTAQSEQWADSSLQVIDQIEEALSPTLTQMTDQLDSALDTGLALLDQHIAPWIEETTAPVTHTINPWLQNHPTCVGCRNYHGTAYGENMLVCGMHPYGPDESTCPDWESVWPTDPPTEQ